MSDGGYSPKTVERFHYDVVHVPLIVREKILPLIRNRIIVVRIVLRFTSH
jgi:hypothetical protein